MIQKKSYDNFKELQNDAINNHFMIYGDLNGHNNKFESIFLPVQNYICGLVYYNLGIESQLLLLDDGSSLFVGFERSIMGIDCRTKKEIFQKESIAPFYEFIETGCCILAICELDIFAYDFECQPIWFSSFRDIVEDYNILDGNKISIVCSNGDESVLALQDGTIIS